MIYRALTDLGLGNKTIKKGDIFSSGLMKGETLAILEKKDKVAPAGLPPIVALPRFKTVKAALGKIGIIDAGQFLEAKETDLAKAMKTDEAEIRRIKAEMYAQFATPPPARD